MYRLTINWTSYTTDGKRYYDNTGAEVPEPKTGRPFWIPYFLQQSSKSYGDGLIKAIDEHNEAQSKRNFEEAQGKMVSKVQDFLSTWAVEA